MLCCHCFFNSHRSHDDDFECLSIRMRDGAPVVSCNCRRNDGITNAIDCHEINWQCGGDLDSCDTTRSSLFSAVGIVHLSTFCLALMHHYSLLAIVVLFQLLVSIAVVTRTQRSRDMELVEDGGGIHFYARHLMQFHVLSSFVLPLLNDKSPSTMSSASTPTQYLSGSVIECLCMAKRCILVEFTEASNRRPRALLITSHGNVQVTWKDPSASQRKM